MSANGVCCSQAAGLWGDAAAILDATCVSRPGPPGSARPRSAEPGAPDGDLSDSSSPRILANLVLQETETLGPKTELGCRGLARSCVV